MVLASAPNPSINGVENFFIHLISSPFMVGYVLGLITVLIIFLWQHKW